MGGPFRGRAFIVVVLAAALAAAIAACGGDDDGGGSETLDQEGFEITFEYPSDFEVSTDVSTDVNAGEEAESHVAVGVDDKNVLVVSLTELRGAVDSDNLAEVQSEFDGLVAEIAGRRIPGERTTVGGLPAITYEPYDLGFSGQPDLTNRVAVVFDGSTEYQLTCQWDDEHEAEVQDACDLALSTLEPKS